jgi:hypothetical protein
MGSLQGFPYFEVEFNKQGKSNDAAEVKALTNFLNKDGVTDLFVISHGWNNDMADARDLYKRFFKSMREVLDLGTVDNISTRKFAIMAVLWPSAKFADKELIPGGAAAIGSSITNDFLKSELDNLKKVFNTPKGRETLDKAKRLVPKLEDSKKARADFANLLRSLLPKKITPDVDAEGDFSKLPGDEVIQRLSKPVPVTLPKAGASSGGASMIGGAASTSGGSAAGVGQFFSGIKSGASHLLNLITYYQMKERSGIVGSTGVNQVLKTIHTKNPKLKLHLIGHSFGGRLVTSATAGSDDQAPVKVNTLTLLQAAFSHYGFADRYDGANNGFFRKVVIGKTVSGPTLISCTQNDLAVGMGYPLASLLAGQIAAALGDKTDKYGGIGRNGAQKTPEASDGTLLGLSGSYNFQPGKLHNLNSDTIIKSHGDICHNEVMYAILNAVSMT